MLDLLEDLKMPQEFYALLNFNFILIYIIHKILGFLKNQLNYLKYSIFKYFLRSVIDFKKFIFFAIYKDEKFKV